MDTGKGNNMAHIPERMCIVCRKMLPKAELIRLAKENGEVIIDKPNKKPGRGAYICKKEECILRAEKRKALSAKFKMQIDQGIYDRLRGALDG